MLVKNVNFGKATAKITVETKVQDKVADGQKYGEETIAESTVEIVAPNGKIVTDASKATIIGERSIVGKAETQGSEVAEEINNTIKEMEQELLNQETEEVSEVEVAEKIIEDAGNAEKLMTKEEIKEWKKGYNNLVNEGGEGYIPHKVNKEDYDWAVMTLAKNENGSVKENETEIAISQQPYIDGPADEKPIYRALGIDQEGNEYEVKWEVVDYWQALEDESEMCDWDSPAEVEAI